MVIETWCRARNAWADDLKGGGFPTVKTRAELYFAGRKLFQITGIDPHPESIFAENKWIKKPRLAA